MEDEFQGNGDDFDTLNNIDEVVKKYVEESVFDGWSPLNTDDMAPGVATFVNLYLDSVGKNVQGQRMNLLSANADSLGSLVVHRMAATQLVPLAARATETLVEHMKTMKNPLPVLIEISDHITESLVRQIDAMDREDGTNRTTTLHGIMAGIWSATSAAGHLYVVWQDLMRGECTLCGGDPSAADHFVKASERNGEHEKD